MAGLIPFRSRKRFRRRASGGEWTEPRMMVWTGALLGLLYVNFGWSTAPGPVPSPFDSPLAKAEDPWAESRRSAEILRGQEEAPPGTGTVADGASGSDAIAADRGGLRVIDGDTFRLAGETIRIADIDTPELRARCPAEAVLARRATLRLEDLLAQGEFELGPIGGRDVDQYGRKLRVVTR